jgi:hypothetical protein
VDALCVGICTSSMFYGYLFPILRLPTIDIRPEVIDLDQPACVAMYRPWRARLFGEDAGGALKSNMPERGFPPLWSVEEQDACFIVKDGGGQKANDHNFQMCFPVAGMHHKSKGTCFFGTCRFINLDRHCATTAGTGAPSSTKTHGA